MWRTPIISICYTKTAPHMEEKGLGSEGGGWASLEVLGARVLPSREGCYAFADLDGLWRLFAEEMCSLSGRISPCGVTLRCLKKPKSCPVCD
jgi:hypothetical protein